MIEGRETTPAWSPAWQATLAATAIAGTLATACMMPFVALAALTAATMPRRHAAVTMTAIWAVDQMLGFALLGYPVDPSTIAWGLAIGVASVAAMLLASAVLGRTAATLPRLVLAFASAFVLYEAGLFGFALIAGGTGTFVPRIVVTILLNDVCWCAGLAAVHSALTRAAPRTFGSPIRLAAA